MTQPVERADRGTAPASRLAVTAWSDGTGGVRNKGFAHGAYSVICSRDGVTAREITRELGADRKDVNRLLYTDPFIRDLCYRDGDYRWHGLIRHGFPHGGLSDYCGWYGLASDFTAQGEAEWLADLKEGCRRIGRNLNDARGLVHSFTDAREVMLGLFSDLGGYGVDCAGWEVAFELRVRRARWVRIYADVLVCTPANAFSLEFKMKDAGDQAEVDQAAKYAPYLQVVLGSQVEVAPALVLTRASDLFDHVRSTDGAQVAVASPDMLFNVFDERLCFLG